MSFICPFYCIEDITNSEVEAPWNKVPEKYSEELMSLVRKMLDKDIN